LFPLEQIVPTPKVFWIYSNTALSSICKWIRKTNLKLVPDLLGTILKFHSESAKPTNHWTKSGQNGVELEKVLAFIGQNLDREKLYLKNSPVTDERVIILNNLRIKRKEIESHPNVKGLISCIKI